MRHMSTATILLFTTSSIIIFSSAIVFAQGKTGRHESAATPEKSGTQITTSSSTSLKTSTALAPQATAQTQTATLGPNLIANPSVETASSNGLPTGWFKGGYGTNTRTLTYPVTGTGGTGSKAMQTTITNYTSGDAKWFFNYVSINPESKYQFSDFSKASVPSIITVQFKLNDGTFAYKDIATVPASSSFQKNSAMIMPPTNAVSLTVFHLINQNGTLATDDYSLNEVTASAPDATNLVANGDFETAGTNGLPAQWSKGGYGTNTRTFTYPIAGASGSGARVDVSGYASGDAKWVFDSVPVSAGVYTYSDVYESNVQSILTAQFTNTDGTLSYSDLRTLPAASSWTPVSVNLTVPANAKSVTIFHLIKQNGSLSLDSVALRKSTSGSTGVFSTGAVTFRFDDNLESQYVNAYPKLASDGFKATYYVISQQTADTGFSDSMSIAQIKDLYAHGNEIGAHTRTHPDLATLTASQQQTEIQGSRQDILAWNVGPVNSFCYPYGSYTATTVQLVKDAGFSSAAATIDGYATPSSDPYQLERQSIQNTTTLADVEGWVNTAKANHEWLILEFHGIDTSGTQYSMTPTVFNQVVDYVKQSGIPVVNISQGVQDI